MIVDPKIIEASNRLLRSLQANASKLVHQLEEIRDSLSHGGQKGNEIEKFFEDLLKQYLPENLGFAQGFVISSSGFRSKQIDIIVYDKSSPILFYGKTSRVIPIEYVYAVVEIKTILNKKEFEKTLESHAEIKRESKRFVKEPGASYMYHAYGADWVAPPVASLLLACESDVSGVAAFDWYASSHDQHPINENVDVVFVNPSLLLCRLSHEIGFDMYTGDCKSIIKIERNAMSYLIALLVINSTDWRMRERPEMYRYFTGVEEEVSAREVRRKPSHPDIIILEDDCINF